MNDPRARQSGFNALSRDQWESFRDHRRNVSTLLGAGNDPGEGRICVLGAGNGNDLDLPALLRAHREVHLVDLDPVALAEGARQQGVADHPGLHLAGGVDLTAMVDAFSVWGPTTPIRPEDVTALAEWPARFVGPALPGPFDLVASTCLLSQLIGNAFHSVGEGHPHFLVLIQAIRSGHLRLMTDLLAPGGTGMLITDIVCSDTFSTLASLPESSLPGLLPQLIHDRNFFHGVHPAVLASVFRQDPFLSARITDLETISPWRWALHDRVYLVLALRYRRSVGLEP